MKNIKLYDIHGNSAINNFRSLITTDNKYFYWDYNRFKKYSPGDIVFWINRTDKIALYTEIDKKNIIPTWSNNKNVIKDLMYKVSASADNPHKYEYFYRFKILKKKAIPSNWNYKNISPFNSQGMELILYQENIRSLLHKRIEKLHDLLRLFDDNSEINHLISETISKLEQKVKKKNKKNINYKDKNYWFVCQGKTFNEEEGKNYLWAPRQSKDGRSLYHWENMKRIKKGDIIVNYANGKVQGYSKALSDYYESQNPIEQNNWNNEGYKVEIDFIPYKHPFSIRNQSWKLSTILKGLQGPFAKDGNIKQGYLFEFNKQAFEIIHKIGNNQKETKLEFINILDSFIFRIQEANLSFENPFIKRFIASLLSKKFIILTGLSGSGKTKLAQAFAEWICEKKQKSNDIKLNLKINKSALEHNGWTLPNEDRKKILDWNQKEIQIEVDGDTYKANLDNTLRLFYDNDLKLNKNYDVGDNIEIKIKNLDNSVINNTQYKLVPVGADWTNREPLLGYPNALQPGRYVKPDNGVLDLLLEASENLDKPYFLILDEMNLSHVERYFADFLSAMESEKEIYLHPDKEIWKNEDKSWKDDIPDKIKMPDNLYIIGTVNIDETTYMFSPKVLDRAHVLEFRVTGEQLDNFMQNPVKPDLKSIASTGSEFGENFVELSKIENQNIRNKIEETEKQNLQKTLKEFFSELKKTGTEFGYRTASEIFIFCNKMKIITEDEPMDFEDIVDAAVLQKLLPKLHGSRKKLKPVLNSLTALCLKTEKKNELIKKLGDETQTNIEKDLTEINEENIRFRNSYEKIQRMKKRLMQDGFTSFAEA